MADIPGDLSTTATLTVGSSTAGSLETVGDRDWFRIDLTAGDAITVFLDGITLEDPYLRIRDAAGNIIYENDDISLGVNRDSLLSFTATYTGTYYLDVGSWNDSYTGTYELGVTPYTPPPVGTMDDITDQLVSGYWGGYSYHFNVTEGGSITVNLTALTFEGQNLARHALALWTDIIGVTFVEVAIGGEITFDDNEEGAFADFSASGELITSAHVNVSTQWLADYGTGLNSYSFQTYIHEIGHALGLGHAGNYNGTAEYPYDALFQIDGWPASIMSYFDQQESTYWGDQGFTVHFVVTPMIADILAMSALYGLSTTTRTGDTTYGFNSNAGRAIFNAGLYPDVAYTIFDSGGTDTLNYSGFSVGQLINLNGETFSNVGGFVGNVAIARGVVIENAIGGSGDDRLIGNAANNVLDGLGGNDILSGGAGNDILNGGEGIDRATYASALAGVTVSLASLAAQDTGGAGIDTIVSVENLTGSSFGDTLTGNSGANWLDGGAGADTLAGGGGNDIYVVDSTGDILTELAGEGRDEVRTTLTSYALAAALENLTFLSAADSTGYGSSVGNYLKGGGGHDRLYGRGGSDTLVGGLGNDSLFGEDGADTLLGGGGFDYLNGGLGDDSLYGGDDADHLRDESGNNSLFGDGGNDRIYAGAGGDYLDGGSGDDSIFGGGGKDRLNGSAGADYLFGGEGSDRLYGGDDSDNLRGYNGYDQLYGEAGDDLLYAGNHDDYLSGGIGNDSLFGEADDDRLYGGDGDDYLDGSYGNDQLYGEAGADRLRGRSGADHLDGGAGDDRLYGADANDTLIGGDGADQIYGEEGSDTLDGGIGNDLISGGLGSDQLTGGEGNDIFQFDAAISGVDSILDFSAVDDAFSLNRAVFSGVSETGALSPSAFHLGKAAGDADDRIIYDQFTGRIFYDADGAGGAAHILFATVTAGTELTNADFYIYG